MPSTSHLLALSAVLAFAALPSVDAVRPSKQQLREKKENRKLLRQIKRTSNAEKKHQDGGLEEDVEFWTNMIRKTQQMSVPVTRKPVMAPSPTNPPFAIVPTPTEPPVFVSGPPVFVSGPPVGVSGQPVFVSDPPVLVSRPPVPVTGPPQPAAGIVCALDESCLVVGDTCTDGTTETCCDETFDSFICTCEPNLKYSCMFTDACLFPKCETPPPVDGGIDSPIPTPAPIPATGGFKCPDGNLIGCTAVDPTDPQDECPTVGEPCPNSSAGEFCCQDGCPRNYCTAKQAPMELDPQWFLAPIYHEGEVQEALTRAADGPV